MKKPVIKDEICRMWDAFREHIQNELPEVSPELLQSLREVQFPSIRLNPIKKMPVKFHGTAVPWENQAVQLQDSPSFYLDPCWHAGAYYVQESSSMFLGEIIRQLVRTSQAPDLKVLDLCAAPGGKSTHILSVIPDDALLLSNEIISKRNAILRENITRWGKPNVIITQNEARDFSILENYFDMVVVDAPCSGEGLFRKDRSAIEEWSLDNVKMCATRQKDILQSVIPCIKENGFLIYSTCTFERCENEDQIKWLLQKGFQLVPVDASAFKEICPGFISNTYRFYPHKTTGSGFFIACLKKVNGRQSTVDSRLFTKKKRKLSVEEIKFPTVENWIEKPGNYSLLKTPYAIHVFPKNLQHELFYLNEYLHITYFGIELGELKKDIFIPAHALALSEIIKNDVAAIEAGKEDALLFLRKSDLSESARNSAKKENLGWKVIKYKGLNLGWVKVLQDRINNYLPNNWRILN